MLALVPVLDLARMPVLVLLQALELAFVIAVCAHGQMRVSAFISTQGLS